VPRAHRQPDALGSERSSEDSEKAQADESGFVFLILGDRKDARQPISPADDNPDHGNCGASNRPRPRDTGSVRAVLLDHQRDHQ